MLVDLHQGTIRIESTLDVSTTVTVWLPPTRIVGTAGCEPAAAPGAT